MAAVNRTSKTEMKECPSCHEMKAQSRFFTEDQDSFCRRCQIGLLYQNMQETLSDRYRGQVSHGYIYLFHSALMGLYKIGRSINPNERKSGLSIPDVKLVFAFYSKHMAIHETLLHHIYKPQRIALEWFRLNDEHVAEVKVIGSKLGIVIDSPEDCDWKGMIDQQEKAERKRRAKIKELEALKILARSEAYKKHRAQFRRRCPNCLRLFRFKEVHEYRFCSKACNAQFKDSKRIQRLYLSDPDNIAIAMVDAYEQTLMYDYDETEIGVQNYRNASRQLHDLERVKAELDELANQAYDLMSKS